MRPMSKEFDCIEMKRQAQERIREATEGMSARQRADWLKREIASSRFAQFLERPVSQAGLPSDSGEQESASGRQS